MAQQRFYRLYERHTGLAMPTDGRAGVVDRRYKGMTRNAIRAQFARNENAQIEDLRRRLQRRFVVCLAIAFAPAPVLIVISLVTMLSDLP